MTPEESENRLHQIFEKYNIGKKDGVLHEEYVENTWQLAAMCMLTPMPQTWTHIVDTMIHGIEFFLADK